MNTPANCSIADSRTAGCGAALDPWGESEHPSPHGVVHELRVLMQAYGRAQQRTSQALREREARLQALEGECMRLRARVMLQQTQLAWWRKTHLPPPQWVLADDEGAHLDDQLHEAVQDADLVICQTGCRSHGDYWRVEDHCRRTGKPCVLLAKAEPKIVRLA